MTGQQFDRRSALCTCLTLLRSWKHRFWRHCRRMDDHLCMNTESSVLYTTNDPDGMVAIQNNGHGPTECFNSDCGWRGKEMKTGWIERLHNVVGRKSGIWPVWVQVCSNRPNMIQYERRIAACLQALQCRHYYPPHIYGHSICVW